MYLQFYENSDMVLDVVRSHGTSVTEMPHRTEALPLTGKEDNSDRQ